MSWISSRTPSVAALALLLTGTGLDGTAWAQTPGVCSNTPGSDQRVACSEPADSAEDLDIDLRAVSIETSLDNENGVSGEHRGSGEIGINFRDSSVGTTGRLAYGIVGWHNGGTGNTRITAQDSSITTAGQFTHGLYGLQFKAAGNLDIRVEGSSITTKGDHASGILGLHSGATGDLRVTMRGGSIKTTGWLAHGIEGLYSGGTGNTRIAAQGTSITTARQLSHGLYGSHAGTGDLNLHAEGGSITTKGRNALGVYGRKQGTGNLVIQIENASITTADDQAHGILGWHSGDAGNARITVQGSSITTTGQLSHGLFGLHTTTGDLNIRVEGGSIATAGRSARGVYSRKQATGNVDIRVENASIKTTGEQAPGIAGLHRGAAGDLGITMRGGSITTTGRQAHGIHGEQHGSGEIHINVQGGTILASGTDASGIRVGSLDQNGTLQGVAGFGADGYRRQTVTVNGRVHGSMGAGVSLLGGGKVVIGPQGRVSADSGVAVRASGDDPLFVNIELGGRLMEEAVDGEILNDGRIDLAVNGALLHGGTTDATGRWGANGVWDVLARKEAARFEFVEVYAPRAVLYESLPGLLLRVDEGPPRRRPETPAWTQVEHAVGHGEPAHSRTGARYDYDRTEMLAGMSHAWDGGMSGSLWLRGVRVAAETEVLSGRGELDVRGVGAGLEARWRGEDGLELSGQLSLTDYDVDASSRRHGRLLREVGARALEASLAGSQRVELGPGATLLPRAWLRHAEVEVDDFTDTLGVQASFADESRSSGGLGLAAEWTGLEHSLYGSMDLERLLGGKATAVELSGRHFNTSAERTRAWVGFGGESGGERLRLRGEIRLGDPGGRNEEFAASFSLAGRF